MLNLISSCSVFCLQTSPASPTSVFLFPLVVLPLSQEPHLMEVLLLPWSSSSKILVSNFSLSAF